MRLPRVVWTTTRIRPRASMPSVTYRASLSESGSSMVTAKGSRSACSACAKSTLCLARFARALTGSNSMSTGPLCICYAYRQGRRSAVRAPRRLTFDVRAAFGLPQDVPLTEELAVSRATTSQPFMKRARNGCRREERLEWRELPEPLERLELLEPFDVVDVCHCCPGGIKQCYLARVSPFCTSVGLLGSERRLTLELRRPQRHGLRNGR